MWNTVNKKWPNVNLWQEWVPVSQTIITFSDFSKCDQGIQSEILLQRFNTLFSVTDDEHVVISIDRSVVGHRDVHGSSLQTHVTELLRKLVVLSLQPQAVGNWKCWQATLAFPFSGHNPLHMLAFCDSLSMIKTMEAGFVCRHWMQRSTIHKVTFIFEPEHAGSVGAKEWIAWLLCHYICGSTYDTSHYHEHP